jgi:3'-phosphoadenosine 5'-phosphosulfate sulfotransferase (PAPS reductase)/FAD synthetase
VLGELKPKQWDRRLDWLTQSAVDAISDAITAEVDGHTIVPVCTPFSGGTDSTVLTHLVRDWARMVVHFNTGIGIESTHEFVRAGRAEWGLCLR